MIPRGPALDAELRHVCARCAAPEGERCANWCLEISRLHERCLDLEHRLARLEERSAYR
jgi:hypothetical protein